MSIPENQLVTWSRQGATKTAQETHEYIRRAIKASSSPLIQRGFTEGPGRDFEIYLQGSYKNTTNIRGDSDVDVVVQFNLTSSGDTSLLNIYEQQLWASDFVAATYRWSDFRADVLAALRSYCGWQNVDATGNKSLKLKKIDGKLAADIVPCIQHRKYVSFYGTNRSYIEGVQFWTQRENRAVVNFPKVHFKNGAAKNAADKTNGNYKPIVRMFKNARSSLASSGVISKDVAPSYFLECLLYNVPDHLFVSNLQQSYIGILGWLLDAFNDGSANSFSCQNEQTLLFGTTEEQWIKTDALELLKGLVHLWMD
jgi:hypothetical protein